MKKEPQKLKIPAETAVLVDDVVTTGLTFHEVAKVLKRNGVKKVFGVALAHGL